MADILTSAQAQIDDAAQHMNAPAATSPPADQNAPQDHPTNPALEGLDLPFSSRSQQNPIDEKKADLPPQPELLPVVPPPVIEKKRGSKALIFAVLLFLLATLPLAVYFTSQQRQLADLRGRATGPYPNDNLEYYGCLKDGGTPEQCQSGKNIDLPSGYGCSTNSDCASNYCGGSTKKCEATTTPQGPGTTTVATTQTPVNTETGAAGSCYGLGGGSNNQTERDCLANAIGGTYTSGACRGLTVQQCAALGRPVYCSGSQEAAGSARAGEFLSCGGSSTGGCGQVDVFDSGNNLIGFVIDKSGCGASPPTTTTSNPPSREIHIDTPPSDDTDDEPPGGTNSTATPTPTATATATSTPTPLPVAACELIKLYDAAGTEITQSVRDGTKKLAIGEEVTIATSKGNATKARFRIQGIADWAENDTSKTTATEYRLSIHIPSTLTQAQGTFEVEVFVNGVWK